MPSRITADCPPLKLLELLQSEPLPCVLAWRNRQWRSLGWINHIPTDWVLNAGPLLAVRIRRAVTLYIQSIKEISLLAPSSPALLHALINALTDGQERRDTSPLSSWLRVTSAQKETSGRTPASLPTWESKITDMQTIEKKTHTHLLWTC